MPNGGGFRPEITPKHVGLMSITGEAPGRPPIGRRAINGHHGGLFCRRTEGFPGCGWSDRYETGPGLSMWEFPALYEAGILHTFWQIRD